jgi:hypothetical protein
MALMGRQVNESEEFPVKSGAVKVGVRRDALSQSAVAAR